MVRHRLIAKTNSAKFWETCSQDLDHNEIIGLDSFITYGGGNHQDMRSTGKQKKIKHILSNNRRW